MSERLSNSLSRKAGQTPLRKRILIVCEGDVTEPRYFRAFAHQFRALVHTETKGTGSAPKTLVAYACELKKDDARKNRDKSLRYDEVWCVFDEDDHPNLDQAFNQAQDNQIKVAFSSPCFELWLLLHFQNIWPSSHRDTVQRLCRTHLPDYVKEIPFDKIHPNYSQAVKRAAALLKRQTENGDPRGNPSSTVHILTERIIALGSKSYMASA